MNVDTRVRCAAAPAPLQALDDVLAGRLGASGLRRVVLDPWRHGLSTLVHDGPSDAGSLAEGAELLRTKYKPGRKLTAYYQPPDAARGATPQLVVSWHAEPQATVGIGGSRDARVTVLVAPADPSMQHLRRLSRTDHVAELVARLTGRPIPEPGTVRLSTVRYRPGQRHVLRARTSTGAGWFLKTDRDDSGARAVEAAEVLGPLLARRCPAAAVAEPVGYSADDRAAVWRESSGQPLRYRLATDHAAGTRLVGLVGAALRVVHDAVPRLHPTVGHDAGAEVAATLRAGEHIAVLLPDVGATYAAVAADVAAGLDRLPGEAPGFTHGDLKCDNLLVDGDHLRILDLDRSSWADPALDLAKFLADLRWWFPPGERADAFVTALHAGYGTTEPSRWARARLLASLFQLKLAARRCAVHDLDWAVQVRDRVAAAAAVTGQLLAGRRSR